MGWLKGILDWLGRWQIAQAGWLFAKPFLLPLVLTMVAGGAGYLGHLPLMWIVMAAALTFMGVMVGIFFAGAYRDRNTPVNKILYMGTQVNYELTSLPRKAKRAQATGLTPARTLDKTQIGVSLHNSARFPLSIILVRGETEMEGEKPPRSMFPKQATRILPGNTMFVMDDAIEMDGHPCEKLEGHMDLTIKYGFHGKEKFELHFAGRVEAVMRPEGFLQGIITHWDSELVSLPTR